MNLWFWPLIRDGGRLSYEPGLGVWTTAHRYWSYYFVDSFAWDAAGALAKMGEQAVTHATEVEGLKAQIAGLTAECARLRPFEAQCKEAEGTIADLRARLAKNTAPAPAGKPEAPRK